MTARNTPEGARVDLKRFEEAKALLSKLLPVARRLLGENKDLTLRMRLLYAHALPRTSATSTISVKIRSRRRTDRAARARRRAPALKAIERDLCESREPSAPATRRRRGVPAGLRKKKQSQLALSYLSPPPTCPSKGRVKLFSAYAVWSTPVCAKGDARQIGHANHRHRRPFNEKDCSKRASVELKTGGSPKLSKKAHCSRRTSQRPGFRENPGQYVKAWPGSTVP